MVNVNLTNHSLRLVLPRAQYSYLRCVSPSFDLALPLQQSPSELRPCGVQVHPPWKYDSSFSLSARERLRGPYVLGLHRQRTR